MNPLSLQWLWVQSTKITIIFLIFISCQDMMMFKLSGEKKNLFIIKSKSKCNRCAITTDLMPSLYDVLPLRIHFIVILFNRVQCKCLGKLVIIDALCSQFKKKKQTNRIQRKSHTIFFYCYSFLHINFPHWANHLNFFRVGRFSFAHMWKIRTLQWCYDEILLSMPFYDALQWSFSHCLSDVYIFMIHWLKL